MRLRAPLAVALAALLAVGCSGDDEPTATPDISQQRAEATAIELHLTSAELVSSHQAKGPLDGPTAAAVLDVVQQAFDATVVTPLREGEAGSLQDVFTADAAERATGPDRAAIFDEGVEPVGELIAERADVRLTGMHGATPVTELVVAAIDWDLRSGDGAVRVRRVGELTLVPVFGSWMVGSYSIATSRVVGGETTTTTAATP